MCGWRRFVAYVHMCVALGVEMRLGVFMDLEVRGWRLMSSHLILVLYFYYVLTHGP